MISEAQPYDLNVLIRTIEDSSYFLNLKLENTSKVTKLGKEDVRSMTISCKSKYPSMHGVGFPKTLTSLTISGLNYRHLDLRICALETLECLDLSNNAIKKLPWSLWEMKQLSSLNLSNNYISDLPHYLPSDKSLCKNLKNLDMSNNWLDRFPEFLRHCKSLQSLQLANNAIKLVPNFMRACSSTLRLLNLENCKLLNLPSCLIHFSLNELKIDNNPFPCHGEDEGWRTIYKAKCGNSTRSPKVPTLRACCVKSIVQHSVPIPSLPCHINDYIYSVQYCAECMKIVMEDSLVYFYVPDLKKFAREFSNLLIKPVITGFVCSQKCFKRISAFNTVKPATVYFNGSFRKNWLQPAPMYRLSG